MSRWVNSPEGFGLVSKGFHWGMALIIFGLLGLGFWMEGLPVSPFKFELYGWHKSFGLLILLLGSMRLIWRFLQTVPLPLPSHTKQERFLSKTIRIVLYISIFGMPLSGWLMSSAGEFSVSFFGLFEMPTISHKNQPLHEVAAMVHTGFAYALIVSLALHIAGAIKHHVLDRDETLRRMGGNVWIAIIAIILFVIPATLAMQNIWSDLQEKPQNVLLDAPDVIQARSFVREDYDAVSDGVQKWVIDPQESAINFQFMQDGQKVSGTFTDWSASIVFDPHKLGKSYVDVEIDIASIQTGSADRDEQARGGEWFSVSDYPLARFIGESFKVLGANRYLVQGSLTLRGVNLPVSFPFTLEISEGENREKRARMNAHFALQRLDFGIGQRQWKTTETIENAINMSISVVAHPVGP